MRSRHTVLTAFTTTAFVFWKTAIFLMLYVKVPEGNPSYFTEGTPMWKIVLVFWVPNGFWFVVPLVVMAWLWNDLAVLPAKTSSALPIYSKLAANENSSTVLDMNADDSSKESVA